MPLPLRPLLFSLLGWLVLAPSIGCGSGRGSFDGAIFRDGPISFRVNPVPNEWRAISVSHATLAFRDEKHLATIVLNARCGRLDEDTPLKSLQAHLLIGTSEREIVSETIMSMDAREALHSNVHAKLDGVPRAFDIYILKKDGCVYDFVRVGPRGATETPTTDFDEWVATFRTLPGGGGS